MLNNPTLVKILEDNNKLDSFSETVSGFGSNHKELYKYLNGLDESQSKVFSSMIDSINGPGNAPSSPDDKDGDGKKKKVDFSVYKSNLPYPQGDIETELYITKKSGVGMGEYYAAFKINGVENFESNTYDLKYGDQKIEVKQIEKSSHPSDPAKKGRLTKMDSFGSLLSILTWLRKLKKSDKDGDWEKFQTERPDLKKVLDQIYDPKHEHIDKILTGEIPTTTTQSKRLSNNDRFKLISRLFLILNKYHKDKEVLNYPNLSSNYYFDRLWDHPYVVSYREGLRDLVNDMNSVWKNDEEGNAKDIYVLLFADDIKKVFYGPGDIIFPTRYKPQDQDKKTTSPNNTNVSRGGVRFFKNPELTEKVIQRLKELAGITK
jgi:hypothetical protein